jgi:hypothetical protein
MTPWFDVAVVATIFAVGNILFGHFEERTPKWRRVLKVFIVLGATYLLSSRLGRVWVLGLVGVMLLLVLIIHGVVLPRRGINGWTGEPRERYYAFRGWTYPPERDR